MKSTQDQFQHTSLTGSPNVRVVADISVSAIQSLKNYFWEGGVSIVQAAFSHTYFVHPDRVREDTPFYPNVARVSNEHYPGLKKSSFTTWAGDGREVRLDDNRYAQYAWTRYTRRAIARGSGYGLRHIWGNPWNPEAFTAGWNFCYMPFWAGMLTESQHPDPEIKAAVRQASWDLYFRNNPVCPIPEFVDDPGADLDSILNGQPILILQREPVTSSARPMQKGEEWSNSYPSVFEHVKGIRKQTRQSWISIRKASMLLQGKDHVAFGSVNVQNSAKYCARRIQRETGMSFEEIETLLDENGLGQS